MTKQEILSAYKNSGFNAQDLMKLLNEKFTATKTSSHDGSLAVYEGEFLVVMVSSSGVDFFQY